jgi:hypothetical protein
MSHESPLDKVLRFSQGTATSSGPGDELRELARAVHLALSEACQDPDPAHAAELVYAAAAVADDLNTMLYGDDMSDWVEATSVPDGTQVLLASDTATKPYGDVPYADPGYLGGRKRYPIDEKHVRAAWSYISQGKNAARYTASQLTSIKGRIKAAMHSHGHGVNVEASAPDQVALAVHAASHAAMTGTHSHEHSHTGSSHDQSSGSGSAQAQASSAQTQAQGPRLNSAASGVRHKVALDPAGRATRSQSGISSAAQGARNFRGSASEDPPVLAQLCNGEAWVMLAKGPPEQQDIPMHHAPFNGTHEHAHSVSMTHGHPHSHAGDNSHGSQSHGNNAGGQKAWAAKGQDSLAMRRYGSE